MCNDHCSFEVGLPNHDAESMLRSLASFGSLKVNPYLATRFFRVCQRDIMEKSLGLTAVFAIVFVVVNDAVVDDVVAVVGAGDRVC